MLCYALGVRVQYEISEVVSCAHGMPRHPSEWEGRRYKQIHIISTKFSQQTAIDWSWCVVICAQLTKENCIYHIFHSRICILHIDLTRCVSARFISLPFPHRSILFASHFYNYSHTLFFFLLKMLLWQTLFASFKWNGMTVFFSFRFASHWQTWLSSQYSSVDSFWMINIMCFKILHFRV